MHPILLCCVFLFYPQPKICALIQEEERERDASIGHLQTPSTHTELNLKASGAGMLQPTESPG